MKKFLRTGLLVLAALTLGCEQPTADPDQVYRDLLVGKVWHPAAAPASNAEPQLYFSSGGGVVIGGSLAGTWSYDDGTFTLTRTVDSQTDTTTAPDLVISASQLHINYLGGLCYLVPKPDF